jgi:hypothetical protein
VKFATASGVPDMSVRIYRRYMKVCWVFVICLFLFFVKLAFLQVYFTKYFHGMLFLKKDAKLLKHQSACLLLHLVLKMLANIIHSYIFITVDARKS